MKTNTHNQKRRAMRNSKGFTLVETLVAIFILILTITSLITLSAGSFYNVRYAQNQLTASSLNQEMFEYIRHTRDTAVQQDPENGFDTWRATIVPCVIGAEFYCDVNQFLKRPGALLTFGGQSTIVGCEGAGCGTTSAYTSKELRRLYRYSSGATIASSEWLSGPMASGAPQSSPFSRGVRFVIHSSTQVEVIVTTGWKNGSVDKRLQESIILTKW